MKRKDNIEVSKQELITANYSRINKNIWIKKDLAKQSKHNLSQITSLSRAQAKHQKKEKEINTKERRNRAILVKHMHTRTQKKREGKQELTSMLTFHLLIFSAISSPSP